MKLFSFKKKKKPTLDARESKKQARVEESRQKSKDEETVNKSGSSEQKKTLAIKQSSELAEAIIIRPRITEKGTDIATKDNAYAFEVVPSATKNQIKHAIHDLYNVTPTKVRIVQIPKKQVRDRRGKYGKSGGGKKAYVFLKKGDSIEFV